MHLNVIKSMKTIGRCAGINDTRQTNLWNYAVPANSSICVASVQC